jgi:hypothetical protein
MKYTDKMTTSFVVSIVFMEGVQIALAIWLYSYFVSLPKVPGMAVTPILANPFVFFPIVSVSLGWTAWVMTKNYLGGMKYFRSIEKMGLKPEFKVTAYSTFDLQKSFDKYFAGGVTGEVLMPVKGKNVKIMHLYQPSRYIFFSEINQKKIVAVFETLMDNANVAFRIQKGSVGSSGASVKKSANGNDYMLLNFPAGFMMGGATFSGNPDEVYECLSTNFTDILDRLPGRNILIGQDGKLRLIHDGIVDTPEDISTFAGAVTDMLKK